MSIADKRTVLNLDIKNMLFPSNWELLPNSHESWDWQMAYLEMHALSESELIDRSAFFATINGVETYHYRMCNNVDRSIHTGKSLFTRSFFLASQFSTGYATHSLFPYRGKFHPQMVKGLLNIVGVKPGEVIVDPMAGSYTACVEGMIMGINSIGIDISPFCALMGRAKSFATRMTSDSYERLEALLPHILESFSEETNLEETKISLQSRFSAACIDTAEVEGFIDLTLLAFLDSVGYARRRKRKVATDLFPQVFQRYLLTIHGFVNFLESSKPTHSLGHTQTHAGSVLSLDLADNSADCILTSPPYSFAIDYADNDAPQLHMLGVNIDDLKHQMIGLRGNSKEERISYYFEDMAIAFGEMGRILKPHKYCIVIVGSNTLQTGGIKHDEEFKLLAPAGGLVFVRDMVKPIKGIQNSLHEEHIMFFRKE